MLRSKIVKGALQQGFSGRSRWLLHNLGLTHIVILQNSHKKSSTNTAIGGACEKILLLELKNPGEIGFALHGGDIMPSLRS